MPNTHIPLSSNDIPSDVVYTPGVGVAALQGGAQTTDALGNTYASLITEDVEPSGYIAASSPPSATNVGSDTPYTFSSQVNHVLIQNNTSANVNVAFDVAASGGSLVLIPGTLLIYPKKCTVLHLYTASAQNINGTSAGNIVVLGEL
jgi:hypothetical protein